MLGHDDPRLAYMDGLHHVYELISRIPASRMPLSYSLSTLSCRVVCVFIALGDACSFSISNEAHLGTERMMLSCLPYGCAASLLTLMKRPLPALLATMCFSTISAAAAARVLRSVSPVTVFSDTP